MEMLDQSSAACYNNSCIKMYYTHTKQTNVFSTGIHNTITEIS